MVSVVLEMGLLPQHVEWPAGWAWHRWHRHRSGGKRSGNCFWQQLASNKDELECDTGFRLEIEAGNDWQLIPDWKPRKCRQENPQTGQMWLAKLGREEETQRLLSYRLKAKPWFWGWILESGLPELLLSLVYVLVFLLN